MWRGNRSVFVIPVGQPVKGKYDKFPAPFRFGFSGWMPQSALLLGACAVLHYPQRQRPLLYSSRTEPESHLWKQGGIFKRSMHLDQNSICSKVWPERWNGDFRNNVCQYIKYHTNFSFLWIFLNWIKPAKCVISQERDALKVALRSISNSHLLSSSYSLINRVQPGS